MPRLSSVLAFVMWSLIACAEPNDTLFTRPTVPPVEIAPGLFRVTWNPAADVVRGFAPGSDRIVYQTRDLPGFERGWAVFSVGVTDGAVREEAGIYRLALPDTTAHIVLGTSGRLMVTWHTVPDGGVTCGLQGQCPPPPVAIDVAIRRLPLTDGTPLSALSAREFPIPNHASAAQLCVAGFTDPTGHHRIRSRPADREAELRRVNPFGPAELADGSAGFFSDGETIWRYDPADPAAPPDSVGPGAFPALSPDGLRLAVAVPLGLDSSSSQCQAGLCPCVQDTWTITNTGWQVMLYDVAGGSPAPLAAGLEPVFDPLEARLVVRRSDGLHWVALASGESTDILGTDRAYAPAISPDGALLAFTAERYESPDVFFLRIR